MSKTKYKPILLLCILICLPLDLIYAQEAITGRLYLPVSGSAVIMKEGPERRLLVGNYLSSNMLEIDRDIVYTQTYSPFGNTTDGNISTDKQFTSHRKLENLKAYHAGARFYSPTYGTFIQPDRKEGPNRYAYVSNNPVEYIDPDGHQKKSALGTLLNRLFGEEGSHQIDSVMVGNGGGGGGSSGRSLTGVLSGAEHPVGLPDTAAGQVMASARIDPSALASLPQISIEGMTLSTSSGMRGGTGSVSVYGGSAIKIFDSNMPSRVKSYEPSVMATYRGGGNGLLPEITAVMVDREGRVVGYQMEYIEGASLNHFRGRLPTGSRDRFLEELALLQGAGFFHGDIKPPNMMIEMTGRLRLIDPAEGMRYTPHTIGSGRTAPVLQMPQSIDEVAIAASIMDQNGWTAPRDTFATKVVGQKDFQRE